MNPNDLLGTTSLELHSVVFSIHWIKKYYTSFISFLDLSSKTKLMKNTNLCENMLSKVKGRTAIKVKLKKLYIYMFVFESTSLLGHV